MISKQSQSSFFDYLLGGLLPLLSVVYLVVFTYATNVEILTLSSIWGILGVLAVIAVLVFILWSFFLKKKPYQSALAAFLFMILFLTYGNVFKLLDEGEFFPVRHFNLIPLVIVMGIYMGGFVSKMSTELSKKFWMILISIASLLLIINLAKIIPIEIQKHLQKSKTPITQNTPIVLDTAGKPDIYWLIFDEFSGFDAMREYFQYPEIDNFVQDLENLGFHVVEDSHASSALTLHQIASRLNYEQLAADLSEVEYYARISNSKVMSELKSRGYTTAVLDEARSAAFGFQAKTPINSDIQLDDLVKSADSSSSMIFGSFGLLVARQTMLAPLTVYYNLDDEGIARHRDTVYFVADELAKLDIPEPKFVYSHLLLPHMPFLFTENGTYLESPYYHDWDYYLGQYKFSLKIIMRTIRSILDEADPKNPPVIILQSDHGARNLGNNSSGRGGLENFPDEYRTSILFAVYAPGCPALPLEDGIDPVNTFPLVFNCLFDMDIPLQ
jgi:hypothetical protein